MLSRNRIVNSGSRYQHVCLETAACTIPPNVITSEEIEDQLAPVYDRLGLPAGRLEMMTGIQERRFFRSRHKTRFDFSADSP